MYIKLIDGLPINYSVAQLRKDNPQISFPKIISEATLAEFGLLPVTVLTRPEFDPKAFYLKASSFYQVDGKWQMHYIPERLPEAQVAEAMREDRDKLLAASDWVVAFAYERGEAVSVEWVDYRQALRDVPLQEGFPFEIEWPVLAL
jgi:hypothetical protein